MAEFLTVANPQESKFLRLGGFSRKVSMLLQARANSQTGLLACLDDLLGAVYNLFYALHHDYADRPQPLSAHDIGNVLVRARDMGNGRIRTEGKWTAGVYFNNALFRLAGLYHRTLKIASGKPNIRKYPDELLPKVQQSYQALNGTAWNRKNIAAIYREVNGLKHKSKGVALGRKVTFPQAVEAVHELLSLIEVVCH
jgi:hypothetical protein